MTVHSKIKVKFCNFKRTNFLSTLLLLEILFIYPYINRYFDGQTHLILSLNKAIWSTATPILIIVLLNNVKAFTSITDKILLALILYITTSLLVFSFFNQGDFIFILRELSYSIVPIICYFIYRRNDKIDKDIALYTILLIVFISGITGLWGNSSLPKPSFIAVLENKSYMNFQSFYSPIIYASIGPICLATLLLHTNNLAVRYKFLMGLTYFTTSILTLQRAAFLGIIMLIIFMLIFYFRRYFLIYMLIICSLIFLLNNMIMSSTAFSELIIKELMDFNLSSVVDQRQEQTFIFNNYSVLKVLLGEGFGKYSPQNEAAFLIMPDASFHRLFNELGIIGCSLFFFAFISIFLDFVNDRNPLGIFIVVFVLTHFYFNRVLMAIPSAYFIYIILGLQLRSSTSKKID